MSPLQHMKFLVESVVSEKATVRELKEKLLDEIREQGINFPFEVDR